MDDVGALLLSGVASGGTVAAVGWAALKYHLGKEFCSKDEANGLGSRVKGLEESVVADRRALQTLDNRVGDNTRELRLQWERIAEHVIKPLDRIADKLESLSVTSARQSEAIEGLRDQLRTRRP